MSQSDSQQKSDAERCAMDLVGHVAALTGALRMIEQGYIYRGSERIQIGAEQMRAIAATALTGEQRP